MSNDQIIRSTKPHEVTIPEGSNNARSIRNKVGQRELEQEHHEKVTVDNRYTDRTVHGEAQAIADHHEAVEHDPTSEADRVAQGHEDGVDTGRIKVAKADQAAVNRAHLETSQDTLHREQVDTDVDQPANRAKLPTSTQDDSRAVLPPQEGRSDQRASFQSDTQDDERATLSEEGQSDSRANLPGDSHADHRATFESEASAEARVPIDTQGQTHGRATLDDDQFDSRSQANEGATSSEPVNIPSDSLHDSFATIPAMTHNDSSPVAVDGHGITDPDRVIVESTPKKLAEVAVPHVPPEAASPAPAQAEAPVAVAATAPPASVPAKGPPVVAQVSGHLVDKKAEEFRGRVVKLRDEVDKLNHRLDDIKK